MGGNLRDRKHGLDNSVHSSVADKVSAIIGNHDTLTSAPIAAFGFLPPKAGALPTGKTVPAQTTVGSLISGSPSTTTLPVAPALPAQPPYSSIPSGILPKSAPVTEATLSSSKTTTAFTKNSPQLPAAPPSPNSSVASSQPPLSSGSTSPTSASNTAALEIKPRVTTPPVHTVNPSADVILDSTIGQTGQPAIAINGKGANTYTIDASLGLTLGTASTNVFFSFSQFSLATNEVATFTGPNGVQNILARVTGGSPSNIDGTINVNIPGANFYLMNSAGVFFTSNAHLDVLGSFAITTASYLKMADGSRFTAFPSTHDNTLSSAAVGAFGFFSSKASAPGPVNFTGSQLSVPQGAGLTVVAGNQTINSNAGLSAPAGQIILVSVMSVGTSVEIPANPATLAATPLAALSASGTIGIDSSLISVGTSGTTQPGHVEIDAGTVNLTNCSITANMLNIPSSPAKNPSTILVRSQTLYANSSIIEAQALGFGSAGTIDLQTQNLTLTNAGGAFASINTLTAGQSSGGSITVTANNVTIAGSAIETSTTGSGGAGDITVTANNVSIDGGSSPSACGIIAQSGEANSSPATGRSGNINVSTQILSLTAGGQISATTFGPGNGGNVLVDASSIYISGYNSASTPLFQSGIFASSQLPGIQGSGGQGGSVTISTNTLNVSGNGLVTASTVGSGGSGNLTINAASIVLDATGATLPTGIAATTSYQTGGKGGNITIQAGSLQVINGAEISSATSGGGASGNVSVSGGSILVSGTGSLVTAQTTAAQGGAGGSLALNVNSLSVADGGQISASTQGSGRGGSISINASQVTIEGGSSSIVAQTSGTNTTVTDTPPITDVSVTLTILTTTDSRIEAFLEDPGTDNITLFNSKVATGANFCGTTFSDRGTIVISAGGAPYNNNTGYQPATPFSALDGGVANGTWVLEVGNVPAQLNAPLATLESASLTVNGQKFDATGLPHRNFRGVYSVDFTVSLPVTETQANAGAGGSIQINAGTISVRDGGTVSASTSGDGAAGSLTIQAKSVTIDGSHSNSNTGLFASANAGSTGRGGSISLITSNLQITGSGNPGIDAGIVARSQTSAPAGDINIQAGSVNLDNDAVISSANLASGPAGSVNINAGNSITLQNGSLITVVAQGGTAGSISLSAGQNVELFSGSTITASAGLGGGNIAIQTGGEFYLKDSSVIATAGMGAGGNITIDPEFIILDNGLISANAAAGAGGNIIIQGQYFFDNDSPITATGTTAGTVQITTLPLDIVNALADLQGGFIDLSTNLQEACAFRLEMDASSFIITARGGTTDSPDDPQEDYLARPRQKAKGHSAGSAKSNAPANATGTHVQPQPPKTDY